MSGDRVLIVGPGGREHSLAWACARSPIVDEVVCAVTPEPFHAVGLWYEDFGQTSDREVQDLLQRSQKNHDPGD